MGSQTELSQPQCYAKVMYLTVILEAPDLNLAWRQTATLTFLSPPPPATPSKFRLLRGQYFENFLQLLCHVY